MTLKDIARELNLSYATVSAVMRGRSKELHISEATRNRVLNAANHLGYKPNLAARALRNNRSYNIGILLPSPRDPAYAEMVADIQHELAGSEYTGIFSFWEHSNKIQAATDNILRYNIEGLITNEPDCLPPDLRIPVVTYYTENPKYDYVAYDNEKVVRISLEYLVELGHRKIGFISIKNSKRAKAFEKIRKDLGIVDSQMWCVDRMNRKINGLEKSFAEKNIPDAIICSNDEVAMLVIQYAERYNLLVPRDLSIIGSNDGWAARLSTPPLTTIQRTNVPFGKLLAETLFRRLNNPTLPKVRYITEPALVERESCKRKS